MSFIARGIVLYVVGKYLAYRPSLAPAIAKETPTSTASGARESPLSERIAWFSWAELPSGLSSVILMPYFFVNVSIISP